MKNYSFYGKILLIIGLLCVFVWLIQARVKQTAVPDAPHTTQLSEHPPSDTAPWKE